MIILFILGLLLGAVSVFFALQNVAMVTVSFFSWEFSGSLAFILSLAILSGMLITFLLMIPDSATRYLKYKSLLRENKKLRDDLQKQKELTVFAKHTPPTAEEIAQIEHGAIANGSSL